LKNLEKTESPFFHSENTAMKRDAEKIAVALALAVAAPVPVDEPEPEAAVVGPPDAAVALVVVVVPPTAAIVVVVVPSTAAVVVVPAVVGAAVVVAGAALHSRKLSHKGAVALHDELQHGTVSDGLQKPLIFAHPSAANVGDEM
jgi:hypothetical protein